MKRYTIGLDYGTLSVRALLIDLLTGEEKAECVFEYPHGVLEKALPCGTELPPDWALQVPRDYLQGLAAVVRGVLEKSGVSGAEVAGIGIDFTACTILPTDAEGTPLCERPEFESTPNAYCKLWKHHSAQIYADRIDAVAKQRGEPWLSLYGDRVSSEWMFPKILQTVQESPEVYRAAAFILEAGDWIVWKLTGVQARSACGAGYKAFYRDGKGYPEPEFFRALHPMLEDVVQTKLNAPIIPVGSCAGGITAEMAEQLGLCEGTPVAAAVIDAHASVPASGICDPGSMLVIMGTSSCHMLLSKEECGIPGVCGIVKDGIIPGLFAYEAGQTCVGDSFSWFVHNGIPSDYEKEAEQRGVSIHRLMRERACVLQPGESGLIALDWFNGARSPWMDSELSGTIVGMTIATRPEEIYRALLESTAFGTRRIIDQFVRAGVPVQKLCAAGGIPMKDSLIMQIYADVCNREITVAGSGQSGAFGSAIYAAAAAGIGGVAELSARLGRLSGTVYRPIPENVRRYEALYAEYCRLSEFFGRENDTMHRLRAMKNGCF